VNGLRQRIDVVAPTTASAVRFAGGWLFDHVMAGWEVTAHVGTHTDARPLRILGARVVDLERTLGPRTRGLFPQSLAVDAELCRADPRVRLMVLEAVGHEETDVRLWGDGWPVDAAPTGSAEGRCHRLSIAARAFKAQALAAVQAPAPIGAADDTTEKFRCRDEIRAWFEQAGTRAVAPA
jgi:hypothetical protein